MCMRWRVADLVVVANHLFGLGEMNAVISACRALQDSAGPVLVGLVRLMLVGVGGLRGVRID